MWHGVAKCNQRDRWFASSWSSEDEMMRNECFRSGTIRIYCGNERSEDGTMFVITRLRLAVQFVRVGWKDAGDEVEAWAKANSLGQFSIFLLDTSPFAVLERQFKGNWLVLSFIVCWIADKSTRGGGVPYSEFHLFGSNQPERCSTEQHFYQICGWSLVKTALPLICTFL